MEPNERTPVVERQRWSAWLPTSGLPTHTGSEGRGDEPNIWDRRRWQVKRGCGQPWTKALRAEARRRLVNWSGPGHERTGGWVRISISPRSPWGRRGPGCVLLAWNHDRGRPGTPDPGSQASFKLSHGILTCAWTTAPTETPPLYSHHSRLTFISIPPYLGKLQK